MTLYISCLSRKSRQVLGMEVVRGILERYSGAMDLSAAGGSEILRIIINN